MKEDFGVSTGLMDLCLGSRTQEQEEGQIPADNKRITINIKGEDEYAPRRMRITKKDLEKFGFAVGRAGCRGGRIVDQPQ